ncbi:hypothetical protein SMMN14_03183 [Sphaerulina musiva]
MQPRLAELITTPAQWFPFVSLVTHRGVFRLVRVKAAESTYPDISQGLRTLSSREEHRVTSFNAYAPNQHPNEAERVGKVRERDAGFEWELPFGDPGPEDFALDTIAIFEYSIGFDAGKGTCRPRRVRCLQVLPVTRNVLNEGIVAGTIWTFPKTTRFLLPCGPFTTSPPRPGSSKRDLPQPSTSIIFAPCTINSVHFAN